MSGDMVGPCRLGLGELLWSHTSTNRSVYASFTSFSPHIPCRTCRALGGFSLFLPLRSGLAGYHTLGMGSRQGCVEGVGFHLSTDPDVVLCRACQAFLACWDAR